MGHLPASAVAKATLPDGQCRQEERMSPSACGYGTVRQRPAHPNGLGTCELSVFEVENK